MNRPQIASLTTLRFFAASHVVVYHYAAFYFVTAPWWLRGVIGSGYVGVSFFFVLSGFVLAYTYVDTGSVKQVEKRVFWSARFARIYPVYALSLLLALPSTGYYLVQADGWHLHDLGRLAGLTVQAGLMAQAWDPWSVNELNSPAWSLSDEAFFYALFPVFVRPIVVLRARALVAAAAGLWILAMAVPTLYVVANADGAGFSLPTHTGLLLKVVLYNPLLQLPEFLLGVCAGVLYVKAPWRKLWTMLLVPALGTFIVLLAISSYLPFEHLHDGLLSPLFALLILGTASSGGLLAQLLSQPCLIRLGEASYGIYILQDPLWALMVIAAIHLTHRAAPYLSTPLYFAGFGIVLLTVALATHQFVERPLRRRIRARLSQILRGPLVPAMAPGNPL